MQRRIISCVPVLTASLFAAAFAFEPGTLFAASDCLDQPNRASAPGGHWYYHVDRTSGRKCWYLSGAEPPAKQPPAETPPAQPAPDGPWQPYFQSFLSSLTGGGTSASTAAPQPDGRGIALTQPPAAAKGDDAPPPKRRQRADAKPHSGSLDQAERDALFQEYLRWRERQ
jgi:hypothetical protein